MTDKIVQTATLLILEPIFEADFEDCSYRFRPGRSAHQALEEIRGHIKAGYQAVYDADLKGYFDSIPHERLEACLRMRIADRSVLKLIRMWLAAPVVEPVVPEKFVHAAMNLIGSGLGNHVDHAAGAASVFRLAMGEYRHLGNGLGGQNGGPSPEHVTLADGGKAAVVFYHLPQVFPILMV
jgi:hypothetical protein